MKIQTVACCLLAALSTVVLADNPEKTAPAKETAPAADQSKPLPPARERRVPTPTPPSQPSPSAQQPKPALPSSVTLVVEFIELEQSDLTELCIEHDFTTDATDLRVTLQEMIDEDSATVVATSILHTRSGQRAKTEAIREIIYTVETNEEHPEKFETRNVGLTFEVDPVVSADGKVIDVSLVPELTEHIDDIELGPTAAGVPVKAPIFHTAKVTTSVSVPSGRYVLVGSTNLQQPADAHHDHPIVLVFLRATAH